MPSDVTGRWRGSVRRPKALSAHPISGVTAHPHWPSAAMCQVRSALLTRSRTHPVIAPADGDLRAAGDLCDVVLRDAFCAHDRGTRLERGSSATPPWFLFRFVVLTGWNRQRRGVSLRVGGPLRQANQPAQGWGISVIASGETSVIPTTGVVASATNFASLWRARVSMRCT
jgi:hypothetical protein